MRIVYVIAAFPPAPSQAFVVNEMRSDTLGWKLRRAAQVFAVSDLAAERLRAQLPPAARGKVHTAYVGIPLVALLCVERQHDRRATARRLLHLMLPARCSESR